MDTPIGIIDSGVGGLSIASTIVKFLPKVSIIYIADSKNCPYGQKSKEEIYRLTQKMADFLARKDIKLLVVACNTITVTSIDRLRREYLALPIVGIVPVLKAASEKTKSGKIGIFSTQVTTQSNYQKDLIEKFAKGCQVLNIGSADLVPLIEKLDFEVIDKVLNEELRPFKEAGIDTLALGCSHFPLIKDRIQRILPGVLVLDSAEAVSRQVQRILKHNRILSSSKKPSYNFYTTGDLEQINYFAKELTMNARIERISLP